MISEKKVKPKAESILETAGEIFAERGFRKTTIREICKRSRVNLAAINYYFGDEVKNFYSKFGKYALLLGYFIPGIKYLTTIFAGTTFLPYRQFALFAYAGAFL